MSEEHVPFTTLREDFCEYKVDNGQTLKMKVMLTDIKVETAKDGTKSSLVGLKDLSITVTEKKIDVSGLEYSTPEQTTDKDIVSEIGFGTSRETVNIYETQKALLLVTPRVLKIFLTNKRNKTNSPLLRFTYDAGLNIIEKDSLYKYQDTHVNSDQKPA